MRDLYHDFFAAYSILPAALGAAATTGDYIIDLQGFEGALIIVGTGVITVDMPFQLMHGDDSALGDEEAVPDADLLGSEPTLLEATDNEIKTFGYVGNKRYLRVDTTGGTGIGWAVIVKGIPHHAPVV